MKRQTQDDSCKIAPVRRKPEGSVGFGKTAAKKHCAWAVARADTRAHSAMGRQDGARGHYLCAHNVGEVKRLLHDGHEGLSEVCGNKHVGHGQQAVGSEGLNEE